VHGSCRTVNGRVTVGSGSRVGGLQSVNGSITVDENVNVEGDVSTVNGSVRLGTDVEVEGEVETVNGSVVCTRDVIAGDVTTVNGSIQISRTEVGGNLGTVNGSMTLEDGSRIAGNILVKGKSTRYRRKKAIEIEISDDSVVEGDIVVRDPSREVKVILSGGGKVLGQVSNAEVIEQDS
jgi:DUF4097 and DUF4098 domain-containing protein YvlB